MWLIAGMRGEGLSPSHHQKTIASCEWCLGCLRWWFRLKQTQVWPTAVLKESLESLKTTRNFEKLQRIPGDLEGYAYIYMCVCVCRPWKKAPDTHLRLTFRLRVPKKWKLSLFCKLPAVQMCVSTPRPVSNGRRHTSKALRESFRPITDLPLNYTELGVNPRNPDSKIRT